MLQEIRKIFEERSVISLYDLKIHFDMDEDAVKGMLDVWVKKGMLKEVGSHCGSKPCSNCTVEYCDPSKAFFYEWIG